MFCFIDIETSGIPQKDGYQYSPPSQTEKYNNSRIIEIAYIIANIEERVFVKIKSVAVLVKPEEFNINNSHIHGITQEEAEKKGIKITDFLTQFHSDLQGVESILSYNIDFDLNILLSECYRVDMKLYDTIRKKSKSCVMELSRDFMKVDKYPKLQEIYSFLFGKNFDQKHRALDDTEIMVKCYCKIKGLEYEDNQGDEYIPIFKPPEKKNYINVPYSQKEVAKKLGCKWDSSSRKWYILGDNPNQKEIYTIFNKSHLS